MMVKYIFKLHFEGENKIILMRHGTRTLHIALFFFILIQIFRALTQVPYFFDRDSQQKPIRRMFLIRTKTFSSHLSFLCLYYCQQLTVSMKHGCVIQRLQLCIVRILGIYMRTYKIKKIYFKKKNAHPKNAP